MHRDVEGGAGGDFDAECGFDGADLWRETVGGGDFADADRGGFHGVHPQPQGGKLAADRADGAASHCGGGGGVVSAGHIRQLDGPGGDRVDHHFAADL